MTDHMKEKIENDFEIMYLIYLYKEIKRYSKL